MLSEDFLGRAATVAVGGDNDINAVERLIAHHTHQVVVVNTGDGAVHGNLPDGGHVTHRAAAGRVGTGLNREEDELAAISVIVAGEVHVGIVALTITAIASWRIAHRAGSVVVPVGGIPVDIAVAGLVADVAIVVVGITYDCLELVGLSGLEDLPPGHTHLLLVEQ